MTNLNPTHVLARKALAAALVDNGFTFPLNGAPEATTGYMASWSGMEETVSLTLTPVADVLTVIERHVYLLNAMGVNYFGGWVDGDLLYLDASENLATHAEAVAFGREHDQLAIWDVEAGAEVRLMGGQR